MDKINILRVYGVDKHVEDDFETRGDADKFIQGLPGGKVMTNTPLRKALEMHGYEVFEEVDADVTIYSVERDGVVGIGESLLEACGDLAHESDDINLAKIMTLCCDGNAKLQQAQAYLNKCIALRVYRGTQSDTHFNIWNTEWVIKGQLLEDITNLLKTSDNPVDEAIDYSYFHNFLTCHRIYRQGAGVKDELSKFCSQEAIDSDSTSTKYEFDAGGKTVVHFGSGGPKGRTFMGIKNAESIRLVDPLADGGKIEFDPPEDVCISDVSYGDEHGMVSVVPFYSHYENWISLGKVGLVKVSLFDPPTFPCLIHKKPRPHNAELIVEIGPHIQTFPDYTPYLNGVIRSNQDRARMIETGDFPMPDMTRAWDLLTGGKIAFVRIRTRYGGSRVSRGVLPKKFLVDQIISTGNIIPVMFVTYSIFVWFKCRTSSWKVRRKANGEKVRFQKPKYGPIAMDMTKYPDWDAFIDPIRMLSELVYAGGGLGLKRDGKFLRGKIDKKFHDDLNKALRD